jgi:hypothetical protein
MRTVELGHNLNNVGRMKVYFFLVEMWVARVELLLPSCHSNEDEAILHPPYRF